MSSSLVRFACLLLQAIPSAAQGLAAHPHDLMSTDLANVCKADFDIVVVQDKSYNIVFRMFKFGFFVSNLAHRLNKDLPQRSAW